MALREQVWQEWLLTRPQCIRDLAERFPPGTVFNLDNGRYYLLGYTEEDTLIVSQINPAVDYEGANSAKEYLCASHFEVTQ